ncbi:hypothetical protein MNAN1_000666 [Malassezia nana]|uniref:Uncharacterized protein n=1 Tax=Malassezia nana TaxID=180528 RepID=A0AAF0EJF1_9BASI|nr:hypothetical protein MNAN1_000666 [Malassezia nana]
MMIPLRTLLCVFAVLSTTNAAMVYRPDSNRFYRRQAESSSAGPTSAELSKSLSALGAQATASTPSPPFDFGNPSPDYPGVVAQDPLGPTNPKKPQMNTPVNQTSVARLASVNSVDDWCTFGPLDPDVKIGEQEERVVAYCTKPRNNARVIPDGTVTAAHFVKTPLYVQIMALGDFTRIGIKENDLGGELDPHGQTNKGNPIGGNVTSNISGKDVFYEEWMNYVGHNILCFRVCTAGSDQATPQVECQHTLDEMGCSWVMPGNYNPDSFDTCDADPAYPPGLYVDNGSTSTFQQYVTGIYTDGEGKRKKFTNGSKDQSTPSVAQSLPNSSNCKTVSSISNGIDTNKLLPSTSSAPSSSASGSSNGGGSSNNNNNNNNNRNSGNNNGASGVSASMASLAAMMVAVVAGAVLI